MDKIGKKMKSVKKEMIVFSIAMIVLGLLMVIDPSTSGIVICKTLGIIIVVIGMFRIASYFACLRVEVLSSFGFVEGILLIVFGVIFFLNPMVFEEYLMFALAIVIMLNGGLKIQKSIDLLVLKIPGWWIELVSGIVMIIFGTVVWANHAVVADGLMLFIGFTCIIGGVWDLVSIIVITKKVDKMKKSVDEVIQDKSAVDVPYTEYGKK